MAAKRGRPNKVIPQPESPPEDKSTDSDTSVVPYSPRKSDESKVKLLQYKHDHVDELSQTQSERYQKIKRELQLKRLLKAEFSDKYTDDQRAQLAEKLGEHIADATAT